MELLITQFFPASYYFNPRNFKYSFLHPVLKHSQSNSSLNVGTELQTNAKITEQLRFYVYTYIFMFRTADVKKKDSELNGNENLILISSLTEI
jgi:hypothetical protein